MLVLGLVDVPWWAILIALIVVYVSYTTWDFDYFKKQGIPGPRPIPVLGTMYEFFTMSFADMSLDHLRLSKEKGVVGMFMGAKANLIIYGEEMLSQIMVKNPSVFTNKPSVNSGTLMDYMITNLKDHHWKTVRNEMTPTFTTGKLKGMNAEVNKCAQTLGKNFLEVAKKDEMIELKEYTGAFAMDAIAATAFGIRLDSQKDSNSAFVQHAKKFNFDVRNPILLIRFLIPTLNNLLIKLGFPFNFIPPESLAFFRDIVKQTIEMRKADTDQSRTDFIQLMIKAQRGESIKDKDDEDQSPPDQGTQTGLSTDEILANAVIFFLAGYDTTSTAVGFLMHSLATNPDCQDKLVEEINRVVGDKDSVDYNLLQNMPYLDQCVQESLRLYPPAAASNREVKSDITLDGIFIRKGIDIIIPIMGIHYDPEKWPEPKKFDPERFSPENKKNRSPYHYLPFGYGPRNCIGMRLALQEIKVAIIHVLKNVKLNPCEKTPIPMEFADGGGMLKAKGGLWLKMEQRHKP